MNWRESEDGEGRKGRRRVGSELDFIPPFETSSSKARGRDSRDLRAGELKRMEVDEFILDRRRVGEQREEGWGLDWAKEAVGGG